MKSVHETEQQKNLYEAFLVLENVNEVKRFLEDLCTPAELKDFVDRWRVVPLLKEGIPYRRIYELTGVSVTTIGRVARCMNYGTGGYDLVLSRTHKKQKRKP